jgi:hypothetical protein
MDNAFSVQARFLGEAMWRTLSQPLRMDAATAQARLLRQSQPGADVRIVPQSLSHLVDLKV